MVKLRDNDYLGDDQKQPIILSKASALHPFATKPPTKCSSQLRKLSSPPFIVINLLHVPLTFQIKTREREIPPSCSDSRWNFWQIICKEVETLTEVKVGQNSRENSGAGLFSEGNKVLVIMNPRKFLSFVRLASICTVK